ncbi:MAG: diaminobutyrate acetyltransferase [Alphaproteobacteria bacterium]
MLAHAPAPRAEVGPCFWAGPDERDYFFRAPGVSDGPALWSLAKDSGSLDLNSPYAYLMLGAHFADTCAIAERGAKPVAFVSAFVSPLRPETLFVWQVAVAAEERGQGLAKQLLKHVLARPACRRVRYLEATVTPSNKGSAALFRALARELGVPCRVTPGLSADLFPGGAHEPEDAFLVGPMPRPRHRGVKSAVKDGAARTKEGE